MDNKRVRMTKNTEGSLDGVNITKFQLGVEYNLPAGLADRFVAQGDAVPAGETQAPDNAAGPTETPEAQGVGGMETPEGVVNGPTQAAHQEGPETEQPAPDPDLSPGGGESSEGTPEQPSGADLTERELWLAEAIESLDPDNSEHWNQDGTPAVGAIEYLIGSDVSAEERDAVWAKMQG